MPASSRPAGRRPAASRPTSRKAASSRTASSAAADPARGGPGAPRSAGLTTRAAVLGLVLCALVVSAALPLRELLAQRGDIAEQQQRKEAAEQRVAALEQELRLLDDPAHVAGLARERLHFVKPGETAYVVLSPEEGAAAPAQGSGERAPGADAPWYAQVWGSAEAADRPEPVEAPPADPAPAPAVPLVPVEPAAPAADGP